MIHVFISPQMGLLLPHTRQDSSRQTVSSAFSVKSSSLIHCLCVSWFTYYISPQMGLLHPHKVRSRNVETVSSAFSLKSSSLIHCLCVSWFTYYISPQMGLLHPHKVRNRNVETVSSAFSVKSSSLIHCLCVSWFTWLYFSTDGSNFERTIGKISFLLWSQLFQSVSWMCFDSSILFLHRNLWITTDKR